MVYFVKRLLFYFHSIMSSDEMDQGPKFQSSLEKQGKIAKSWKKYWFVLKEAQLTYVKSQDKVNVNIIINFDMVAFHATDEN